MVSGLYNYAVSSHHCWSKGRGRNEQWRIPGDYCRHHSIWLLQRHVQAACIVKACLATDISAQAGIVWCVREG